MRTILKISAVSIIGISIFLIAWGSIKPNLKNKTLALKSGTAINQNRNFSDFTLQDTNGYVFNQKSLKGYWTMLFFGYSQCPDICPTTLTAIDKIWKSFPKNKVPARFLFANINPNEDTNENLQNYLNHFNSDFLGLVGEKSEIQKLMKDLGVFANQEDSIIEHSNTIFLINPHGKLSAIFSPPFNTASIKNDLLTIVNS